MGVLYTLVNTPIPLFDEAELVNIVFTPSGRRGSFSRGTTVLDAARQLGVDLDSVCGGRSICGRCQIVLSEGSFPKHGITSSRESLSVLSDSEIAYREFENLPAERRLGCATRLMGDAVIDVPPESQVHKQIVRKRIEVHDLKVDPSVKLHVVSIAEPKMEEPKSDLRRLLDSLKSEWGLTDVSCDSNLFSRIQPLIRKGDWQVTVAVFRESEVIAIWPGLHQSALGLAVDVGSTTVAAHLIDLEEGEILASAGKMNPQIRFGEDLMSRVSYAMMHPGSEKDMSNVIRDTINELANEVCNEADRNCDDILDCTLVGNPVMHHLILGISPVELGGAPFALAVENSITIEAADLDFNFNPGSRCYILPCIAGHVGADCAAVVLSEAPYLRDEITLLVDVGTNAEIVLGNRDRLVAASSPTGPAFEGAQISSGQRAAPGAIERVRIDPVTLEPRFKVIGCEFWSDQNGFLENLPINGVTGICGSGIIEVLAEMFLAGIIDSNGVLRGELSKRSTRVIEDGRTFSYVLWDSDILITITQNDIRAIQLAKAALYAGIRLLMDKLQIDSVDRIRLAGAFGSHIDVKYAMILGLIPDCPLDNVTSAGNAAGVGAHIALVDKNARLEIEQQVRLIEKIETAVEPKFQEHFVNAMAIPNKVDYFKNLASVVELPSAENSETTDNSHRKRRRRRK